MPTIAQWFWVLTKNKNWNGHETIDFDAENWRRKGNEPRILQNPFPTEPRTGQRARECQKPKKGKSNDSSKESPKPHLTGTSHPMTRGGNKTNVLDSWWRYWSDRSLLLWFFLVWPSLPSLFRRAHFQASPLLLGCRWWDGRSLSNKYANSQLPSWPQVGRVLSPLFFFPGINYYWQPSIGCNFLFR